MRDRWQAVNEATVTGRKSHEWTRIYTVRGDAAVGVSAGLKENAQAAD